MYALGRGEQVELKRFVHAIEGSLGLKANYDLAPKHPADAKETWSDTTKLQSIGYNPKTSIEEGVDNFVKWYKEHYSA
jgi:UDP-glucuronate 4-epimerase